MKEARTQESARTTRRPRVRSEVVPSQTPWFVKVGERRLKARSVPVGSRFARFAVEVRAWDRADRRGWSSLGGRRRSC